MVGLPRRTVHGTSGRRGGSNGLPRRRRASSRGLRGAEKTSAEDAEERRWGGISSVFSFPLWRSAASADAFLPLPGPSSPLEGPRESHFRPPCPRRILSADPARSPADADLHPD